MEQKDTKLYGLDHAVDILDELASLAHAIEMSGYRWSPADVVRVLDHAVAEIRRLRNDRDTP